jgi:hypothetical protein
MLFLSAIVTSLMLIPPPPTVVATRLTCPAAVADLTPLLLRDLPSYANRVIVRARGQSAIDSLTTVITAGRAEFAPLPVSAEPGSIDPQLSQIFFTTLERQRTGNQMYELQQYHWLFISQTPTGWQLALSYTRTASYPSAEKPITPPRESSQAPIAQAAKLWLRDCNAGSVKADRLKAGLLKAGLLKAGLLKAGRLKPLPPA